jgi:hypothetical protein
MMLTSLCRRTVPRLGDQSSVRPRDVETLKLDIIEEMCDEISYHLEGNPIITWELRQEGDDYVLVGKLALAVEKYNDIEFDLDSTAPLDPDGGIDPGARFGGEL